MSERTTSSAARRGTSAILALAIASVNGVAGAPRVAAADTRTTDISGFAFQPDIVVEAGTTVRWTNQDAAPHTVTADDGSFDSGTLQPGGSFELVAPGPGVISYACRIHPAMTGTLTVESGSVAPVAAPGGDVVVLRRSTLFDTDPLGIGGPALTILVPDGWSVFGGPVWRHQYANLATLEARVASPDLLRAVEFFPLFPQLWQEGGLAFFPAGSNYLGHDVRPPIRDAVEFLETLVLPSYRASFAPAVIGREPLPDVAAAYMAASLTGTEVSAERVLTEHFVGGERMLEEFTVVLGFTAVPGLPGRITWAPQQLFSVRAPAGEFETARPILQAIATSPVIDLRWYAGYEHVLRLSIQNGLDAIRAAGAASRIIAQTNAEITDLIISGYQERQAVNDRIFDAVSQTIRGVETYRDPFEPGGTLELPNGYTYAYGADDGSVILTNEPAFDPVQVFPERYWESLDVQR